MYSRPRWRRNSPESASGSDLYIFRLLKPFQQLNCGESNPRGGNLRQVTKGWNFAARLSETQHVHLLKVHARKNPPHYDDLATHISLSEVPTGRHALTMVVFIVAVTGSIFLLLTHSQH
jgi:hypothetical protein